MAKRKIMKDKTTGFTMTCNKCSKKLALDQFFANGQNKLFYFKDCWCKTCVRKYAKDMNTLKEYCYFNNRLFSEGLWQEAEKYIDNSLEKDEKLKKITDMDKRKEYLMERIVCYYFSKMNLTQWYKFVDNTLKEDVVIELEEQKKQNKKITKLQQEIKDEEKTYSKKWRGYYTKKEVDLLDDYLKGLEDDFEITNINHKDYARKTAQASLNMDMAFADMMAGKAGADKRYKEAKEIFDSLCQSAKFSAKTRSENDNSGFGSLGELIKKLEYSGFAQTKVEFEKDDVDKISDDFRYTLINIEVS